MIEDESEVFEITDFTTASEWERFIAKLEEVIHEWKLTNKPETRLLTKGELTTGKWEENTETLQFADFKFLITRYQLVTDVEGEPESGPEGTAQSGPHGTSDDAARKDEPTAKDSVQTETEEENDNGDGVPMVWQDLMSSENDFPGRCHCLVRWYGLRDFVVMAPGNKMDDILSESRANLLLSSVAIAQHNTSCNVPMFVQLHQRWRRLFLGQCEIPGFRTVFEMVHLKNVPHQYNHMAGLLDVFKAKIASPVTSPTPVSVAVRFTYVLQDWMNYSWPQQPPDLDSMMSSEVGVTEFGDLPFGPCEDPVNELHLSTTWPSLSEEMIVDNDVYSDLDPIHAPHWCVRVRMTENPQCLLSDYLQEFVQLCRRQESTDQLLGRSLREAEKDDTDVDVSHALSRLTEPVPYNLPSLGTVVTRATSKLQMKPEEAPIPVESLNEILLFVFPDAKNEHKVAAETSTPVTPDPEEGSSSGGEGSTNPAGPGVLPHSESQGDLQKYMEMFKQFKSAPVGTLSYRLAVCMCIVNHSYGGLRAVAHLWQEFVLEMRYRWENKILIPDLESGPPNMGCSLLHQKLQMLNCCIERKKVREAQGITSPRTKKRHNSVSSDIIDSGDEADGRDRSSKTDNSVSSEDEFFECMETAEEEASSQQGSDGADQSEDKNMDQSESKDSPDSKRPKSLYTDASDSLNYKPEGRLKPCGELKLLNVDDILYVPVTQEPAPMTEDMLDEHAEVLAKLGTSAEGANLRARMQSACLLSDMESFKAANPGCTLSDFVRWYSPRDWVEEEVEESGEIIMKGQLSARMQIPGNVWAEVWQSAKSVPARRQRRLFDDTKEAEKVLHWLAAMKPADVALRLMPMLVHASITKLLEQEEGQLPTLKKLMSQISNKATKAMRAPRMEIKRFEDLVRQISMAEVVVTQAQSLLTKFSQEKADLDLSNRDLQQFVSSLLEMPDVNIIGAARAPLGIIIHRLFAASQKSAYLLPEEEGSELEGDKAKNIPDFPTPVGKEYILRTTAQRPSPWSRAAPQRMYCVLMKDDFRLAGAFTSDTTFQ